MVVLDNDAYATSTEIHNPRNVLGHRRYPSSIPTIKDLENRGNLLQDGNNNDGKDFTMPAYNIPSGFNHNNNFILNNEHGRAPSIISTISPTVSRKPSKIKQKKRFMRSAKEMKNHFFYPVNGPKRRRSKAKGKYRNSMEMDAIMNYIKIDPAMSKDLCLNQQVKTFQISNLELLRPSPRLSEKIKAITIDSNNNYILYTPNPTIGKNSLISSADRILEQELINLSTPDEEVDKTNSVNSHHTLPSVHRYSSIHSIPAINREVLRTYSMPNSVSSNEKLHALWSLYIRRVIAERIRWRLRNSSSSTISTGQLLSRDLGAQISKKEPDRSAISTTPLPSEHLVSAPTTSGAEQTRRRRPSDSTISTNQLLFKNLHSSTSEEQIDKRSISSSVETSFFMNTLLARNNAFPQAQFKSSSGSPTSTSATNDVLRSDNEDDDPSANSILSSDNSLSPRRAAMFDSLEQLMSEVNSLMSVLN